MRRLPYVLLGLAALIVCVAAPAAANDEPEPGPHGTFAFVSTRFCAQGNAGGAGLDEDLRILSQISNRAVSVRGFLTFDGRGGGTQMAEELQFNLNLLLPGGQQTGGATARCDFRYTVGQGGAMTLDFDSCDAEGTVGATAGLTFTGSPSRIEAQLSGDGKTLLLNTVTPAVTTVTTHLPAGDVVSVRVCSRTGTAVRVH
jgi:hypothetical protein